MKKINLIFIFITAFLLILSVFFLQYRWNYIDGQVKEQTLLNVKLSSIGIDGEMLKKLTGLQEDFDIVAYNSIKDRLKRFKEIDEKISFVYLYTKIGNNLYFIADSELEFSENYSPYGQEYTEAKEDYYKSYDEKISLITKPSLDRWGTWISGLVPIIDKNTGSVRAVFATDYSIESWNKMIMSRFYTSIAINILIFFLLFSIYIITKNIFLINSNKEEYKTLIENMPGVSYRCQNDKDWTMSIIGDSIKEITGYESSDFINNKVRTFESIIHKDDKNYVSQKIDEAIKQNKQWEIVYRIINKDGNSHWVQEKGKAIKSILDNKIYLDGIIVDITSLKNAEEDLKNNLLELEKFKLAVEYSSDHIVITDNQGIVLYANDAVEKITGFPIKEVLGKKAGSKELWGGLMDPEVYKKLWTQISVNKKPFRGEFNNRRKDGRNYVAEAYVSPITNDKNEVIFFVGIERDITKAKEIDKLKDEFVSLTSHELRTPMTAIKGFASMILEGDYGKVPEKIVSPLNDIFSSTERLILLVNDMLNLSRIEAGRLKFNLKEFDPSEVTNSVVDSLKPIAKDKGLILEVEKEEKGKILGDEDKISQVLNNLIGNSLKFTSKGFVKVETTIRKDHFVFLVKDSGIGIAKEDMDKVFGKFEQISSAQMGKPQGTGLGLYISKQIANKLGGDVWIEESTPQKGSVFGFSLPLAESNIAKKVKIDIAKEASKNPDQKEMS